MNNVYINEEAIHYAAAFLERWEEKAPNENHRKAQEQLRKLSNTLLEQLYTPFHVAVIRHNKK